jgi:hypothetical protein
MLLPMVAFVEILDWEARADYNSPLATSKGRPWSGPGVRTSTVAWQQGQRTKDKHEAIPLSWEPGPDHRLAGG